MNAFPLRTEKKNDWRQIVSTAENPTRHEQNMTRSRRTDFLPVIAIALYFKLNPAQGLFQ